MFPTMKWAKERTEAEEKFEATRISDLTVSQFRQLMAQIAYDTKQQEYERSRSFVAGRPQIDLA